MKKRNERPNRTWMRMSLGRIRQKMIALVKEDQTEMTLEEEKTLSLLRKIADYRLERFSMLVDCVSSGVALQISFSVLDETLTFRSLSATLGLCFDMFVRYFCF